MVASNNKELFSQHIEGMMNQILLMQLDFIGYVDVVHEQIHLQSTV